MVLFSTVVKIKGNCPEYKSYKLTFYRYSDLISKAEIKLNECVSDSSGNFECQLDVPLPVKCLFIWDITKVSFLLNLKNHTI